MGKMVLFVQATNWIFKGSGLDIRLYLLDFCWILKNIQGVPKIFKTNFFLLKMTEQAFVIFKPYYKCCPLTCSDM